MHPAMCQVLLCEEALGTLQDISQDTSTRLSSSLELRIECHPHYEVQINSESRCVAR